MNAIFKFMTPWLGRIWIFCAETVDLLDLVLCAAFGLITAGSWLLWGLGWASLVLGVLLLSLVLMGLPTYQGGRITQGGRNAI